MFSRSYPVTSIPLTRFQPLKEPNADKDEDVSEQTDAGSLNKTHIKRQIAKITAHLIQNKSEAHTLTCARTNK